MEAPKGYSNFNVYYNHIGGTKNTRCFAATKERAMAWARKQAEAWYWLYSDYTVRVEAA